VYVAREYAPLPQRDAAFTRYAANLPAALAMPGLTYVLPCRRPMPRSAGRIAGLAEYLEGSVPAVFASVTEHSASAPVRHGQCQGGEGAAELKRLVRPAGETRHRRFALGPERFSEMLRMTEGVDLPLDSLERRVERYGPEPGRLKEACGRYDRASRSRSV